MRMLLHSPRILAAGRSPIVRDRVSVPAPAPGPVTRCLARLRARRLDRALVAGADPAGSSQLEARAARLTAPGHRAILAEGLERLVQAAHGPRRRWWAPCARDHLVANTVEIGELAEILRGSAPVYARGVAMVDQLLTDGAGPAYLGPRETLARRLREARAALRG